MTIDIDAIRQREQAATPGPWGVGNGTFVASELKVLDNGSIQYRYAVAELDEYTRELGDYENQVAAEADAEFIAHARTDVPALLAKVDELAAKMEDARAKFQDALWSASQHAAKVDELTGELADARAEAEGARSDYHELKGINAELAEQQADLRGTRAENVRLANALHADALAHHAFKAGIERYEGELRTDAKTTDDGIAVGLLRAADGLSDLLAEDGAL